MIYNQGYETNWYDFLLHHILQEKSATLVIAARGIHYLVFFVLPRDQLLKFPRYQEKYLQYQYNNTHNIV